MEERRVYERFDLNLPAQIEVVTSPKEEEKGIVNLVTENICAGGAFFSTLQPLSIGADVKINLFFGVEALKRLTGMYSYLRVSGTVLRVEAEGMAICFEEDYRIIPPTKVKKRTVRWNASASPEVASYRLYWAVVGGVNYDSPFAELGDVTEVILPDDVPSFPLVTGNVELGVTAVSHMGNESDMVRASAHLHFAPPDPPTGLIVEYVNEDFQQD